MEIIRKEIESQETSQKTSIEKRQNEKPKEKSTPTCTTTKFVANVNTKKEPECYFGKKGHFANQCTHTWT